MILEEFWGCKGKMFKENCVVITEQFWEFWSKTMSEQSESNGIPGRN